MSYTISIDVQHYTANNSRPPSTSTKTYMINFIDLFPNVPYALKKVHKLCEYQIGYSNVLAVRDSLLPHKAKAYKLIISFKSREEKTTYEEMMSEYTFLKNFEDVMFLYKERMSKGIFETKDSSNLHKAITRVDNRLHIVKDYVSPMYLKHVKTLTSEVKKLWGNLSRETYRAYLQEYVDKCKRKFKLEQKRKAKQERKSKKT